MEKVAVACVFVLYSVRPIRPFGSRGRNREKLLRGQRKPELLKVGGCV